MGRPSLAPRFARENGTGNLIPTRSDWHSVYMLREVRKISARDAQFWSERRDGLWPLIVPEIAIHAEAFQALPPWEKARARAAAQGLTLSKSAICGLSSAQLWGLWVSPSPQRVEINPCEGAKPKGLKQRRDYQHFHSAYLSESEITTINGVRMTTLVRTIKDVVRYHGVTSGVVAIDSLRAGLPSFTREVLSQQLTQGPPYRGINKVREAIALSTGKSESPLESRARVALLTSKVRGLETLEFQKEITVAPHLFRADFLINGWLVVEVDGRAKYDGGTFSQSAEQAIREEREREVHLSRQGFRVLRVHDEDIDNPARLVALVERELSSLASPKPARPA